jgi:hypothetical protein
MNEKFAEQLSLFRRAPGMYILNVTYPEVCAFVSGFDLGTGGQVMHGFRGWLVSRGTPRPELAWPSLVLGEIYPPEALPNLRELTDVENQEAVQRLFELLFEYLQSEHHHLG